MRTFLQRGLRVWLDWKLLRHKISTSDVYCQSASISAESHLPKRKKQLKGMLDNDVIQSSSSPGHHLWSWLEDGPTLH